MNDLDLLSAIHDCQPIAIKDLAAKIGLDDDSTKRWVTYLKLRREVSAGPSPYRCRLTSRGKARLSRLEKYWRIK
jgi:hypothetical protein